jgi:hypothetical protein
MSFEGATGILDDGPGHRGECGRVHVHGYGYGYGYGYGHGDGYG